MSASESSRFAQPSKKEPCSTCGQYIIVKLIGNSLLSFNQDGTVHRCEDRPFQPKPIGKSISGRTIESFHVNRGIVTLVLSGQLVLEIMAKTNNETVKLNLRLISPDGITEEKK